MAILYGIAPVLECLKHRRRDIRRLYLKDGKPSPRIRDIQGLAQKHSIPIEQLSAQSLGDRTESGNHQGVALDVGELRTLDLMNILEDHGQGRVTLVALDQIEDPQNLGSMVRSAAFLGAQGLITSEAHSSPLSPAASKASAGTLEFFPIIVVPNLAQALTKLEKDLFHIWGADATDEALDYRTVKPQERQVVVLGNEGRGLRSLTQKRCHDLVRIPGGPNPDSLNVGVSTGILLAHFLSIH